MSTAQIVGLSLGAYFGVNFICALVLHLHAERQAHLRLRFMDVVVHFVLLTAFALPALMFVLLEALFGRDTTERRPKHSDVSHARAA